MDSGRGSFYQRRTDPGRGKPCAQRPSVRVLLVEDDATVAALLRTAFRRAGIEADCEVAAETATLALQSMKYDCAILDLVLPGSSGLYVVDAVRHLPPERKPYVILMTGAEQIALKSVDRAVVKAIMFKPLNVPALVAFVKAIHVE
jgi:DNA-binding response OmpR family regulator